MLKFLFKAAVTAALLWYLLCNIDIHATTALFAHANMGTMVVAAFVLFALVLPATVRWHYVLQALDLQFPGRRLLQWNLASGFINQVLPSSLGGDLLRANWCRRAGLPVQIALESVAIDRLMAFGCLLLVVLVAAPQVVTSLEISSTELSHVTGILAIIMIAGCITLGVAYLARHTAFVKLVRDLFTRCLHTLLQSGLGGRIVGYGLVVHVMRVWGLWLIALALGVDLSFVLCMALVPLGLLIAMVPITIGGWGLREGAFVALFSRSSVATEEALAISIAYGLLHIISALPGALVLPLLEAPSES